MSRMTPAAPLALIASLCALGISCAVHAAESVPLSMDEAVELALREAPQITASVETIASAAAIAPGAGRLPDPELITGIDNLPVDGEERFSLTRDFMTMSRIGVMQSVPSGAKRRLRSERAQREIALAQAQLRSSRFDVARATAEAWIAGATREEALTSLRDLKPEAETQAAAARAALASGRTAAAEALDAQMLVARLDERIASLEQELAMRRAELGRWIGRAADRKLGTIPTDRALEHNAQQLLAAVPEHAPLAPLIAQLDAARTDVALARAEKRPDWSGELTFAKRGPDFSNMVSLEFRVGLPLFAANRQDPLIAGKLATVRAQEAMRDAQVRMHRAEIEATLAQWRIGRERLQRYSTELLPLARDRTRTALASYRSGRGALRSAIEALSLEIDTRLDYVELEGAVARAWTFLHFLHDTGVSP